MDPNLCICIYFSCHEQCCLFECPSLAIILECSRCFINFIPYLMADPSYPFVPVLMMLVFKRKSLHTPNTNIFSLPTQTPSALPFLHHVLLFKHSHPFTSFNHCTMTPAKGQSSSRRKGKEIVSDPPSARDVGEKAMYSESNHFDEEEAQRALDSECTPFIDPWYDIHAYFPKIPCDYMPTPSGRVWLAFCRRNTNVSWAPLASLIPDLVIRQGTSLPVPIHFKFGSGTELGWKE